jgi:hypothetical protein
VGRDLLIKTAAVARPSSRYAGQVYIHRGSSISLREHDALFR